MRASRILLAASLVAAAACAPSRSPLPAEGTRSDSRTVSQADLSSATQLNMYDYIAANRPRWLRSSSPANIRGQSLGVAVFLGTQSIGGIDNLRSIAVNEVREARYYTAAEAQQRFNVREVGAVIQIVMK